MDKKQQSTKVQSVILNTQYMNNTKAHRALTTRKIGFPGNIKNINVDISLDNHKGLKSVFLNLSKDDHVELTRPISPFDGAILDTIYSISAAGYPIFTIEQVARALTGNSQKKVTPKLIDEIAESIDMLRKIDIKIYGDSELDEKTKKKNKFLGYLLPVEYVEETIYQANGKITKNMTYRMRGGVPALYEYAEAKKQIISVDMSLLDTSDTGNSDTIEYILIKRYILKRIQQIKANNRLHSNKISLEWKDRNSGGGLLHELDYTPDMFSNWRKKRSEIIKDMQNILDYYVSIGEIKGFESYRSNNSKSPAVPIQGFCITV